MWELEKQSLYQQLDDKDEEINNQCQLVEQMKEQQMESEELLSAQRRDFETLQNDLARKEGEIEAAKDEVKEVLQVRKQLTTAFLSFVFFCFIVFLFVCLDQSGFGGARNELRSKVAGSRHKDERERPAQ